MSVSVVVATRDRASYLEQALQSLRCQRDAPPFEAIVVDNGSSDATPGVVDAARSAGLDVRRVFVAEPNRAKARNAGVERASGALVAFVDDDVWLPEGFLAAHARAHDAQPAAVSGPILNVPSYDVRPSPSWANYSGAFLCTCNVSLAREAFVDVGGFDESFNLYGWEDTELGLRLRRNGVVRRFAWEAYLYHIKPPDREPLDHSIGRVLEKARMAARLLEKDPSARAKLATGAYHANLLRARVLAPSWALPWYAGIAEDERIPGPLRALAKAQLLDGAYTGELRRALDGAR